MRENKWKSAAVKAFALCSLFAIPLLVSACPCPHRSRLGDPPPADNSGPGFPGNPGGSGNPNSPGNSSPDLSLSAGGAIITDGHYDFGYATFDSYCNTSELQTITVTNMTNRAIDSLAVGFYGSGNGFVLNPSAIGPIAARGYATFTVARPSASLDAQTHSAIVLVSDGNGIDAHFTARFRITPAPIANAAITVTAPVLGVTPDEAAERIGAGNFTVGAVEWSPPHDPHNQFRPNVAYTAAVTLTANDNFTFAGGLFGGAPGGVSINGFPAAVTNNTGETVTLSIAFPPVEPRNLAAQLAWLRSYAQSGGSYAAFAVLAPELLTPAEALLPTGRNVAITIVSDGATREVRLSQNGVLFAVPAGVTLALENVTLVGRSAGGNGGQNNNSHLVRVEDGGVLIMNAGATITGNTNVPSVVAGRGGGVRMDSGGRFYMHGGEISHNTTTTGEQTAGGVLVIGDGAVFTMTGGLIHNNTVGNTNSGGGVNLVGAAAFTMTGGAINFNTAGTSSGAGVNAFDGGAFEMRGGSIASNTATSGGGGVRVNRASFAMHNGEITGNGVTGNNGGGGVSVLITGGGTHNTAAFTMYDGRIFGNETAGVNGGGGVRLEDAAFTMFRGEIFGNTVSGANSGGGVYAENSAFAMHGGRIFDNIAGGASSGGGVNLASDGAFVMYDGRITGNNTFSGGGGVRVNRASFTMHNGEITGNETAGETSGAGVSVLIAGAGSRNTADFTMRGGLISGNTGGAATGGGVNISNSGTFVMAGGRIVGNSIYSGGAGVRVGAATAVFNMTGGEVTGNTATGANSSSGVSILTGGTFRISNGLISGNAVAAASSYAALRSTGSAQRGTFSGDAFTAMGALASTNSAIQVASGVLQ